MAQVGFWREVDQGFTEGPGQLSSECVEKVGGRRDIGDHDCQLGAHLEESFHTGAAVFGSLSFISMGQEERDAIHALPFLFGGGDELVDRSLGPITEVTELGFPQYERVGVGQCIAIFKSQYSVFAKQ